MYKPLPTQRADVIRYQTVGNQVYVQKVGSDITSSGGVTITDTVRRLRPTELMPATTQRQVEVAIHTSDLTTVGTETYNERGPVRFFEAPGPRLGLHSAHGADFVPLEAKLRAKIKSETVNVAVALAERKQTAGLVSSAAKGILSFYRSVRDKTLFSKLLSRRRKNLPPDFHKLQPRVRQQLLRQREGLLESRSRDLADAWLQFSFGMRPLYGDINAAVEETIRSCHEGVTMWVRTHSEHTFKSSTTANRQSDSFVCTFEEKMKLRAKASYRISDTVENRAVAMGLTNPLQVAWELVPYSFVIDWILPVGDYLSSIDSLLSASHLTVYRGMSHERRYEVFHRGANATSRYLVKVRHLPNSTLALPRLEFKHSGNEWLQTAHSMALLRQLRR